MNPPYASLHYGHDHDDQYLRLYRPSAPSSRDGKHGKHTDGLYPVVVLIHGGFFKHKYTVDNSCIIDLIPSLLSRNIAACLVEYRRVGSGGGYPYTNDDILSALIYLQSISVSEHIDARNIILVGHSAGGTLALWCCSHVNASKLSFPPRLCIALAPIGNLVEGHNMRLSDEGDAILKYMGGEPSDDEKCAYRQASPHYLLPLSVCNSVLLLIA
jgi:dipeptidyl aminopeptidase/acylaminoacyl peptidase